jgi:phospholipid/cholesterol/gamma-HCH transport system permease protein
MMNRDGFPLGLLALPGRAFLHFLLLGQLTALMRELMIAVRSGVWRLKLVAQQIVAIGYGSQGSSS